ncbi:uncharacterized protein LOC133190621 [Saccostrea echinata]|uniref:uncharacterized protein LOC133190621 n=1 Tax=Saccostrea echinata TaxID=191078 RepID=UPI002A818D1A|nr:uncharacterized protein LOC133190621 [Saccostrea echinata]
MLKDDTLVKAAEKVEKEEIISLNNLSDATKKPYKASNWSELDTKELDRNLKGSVPSSSGSCTSIDQKKPSSYQTFRKEVVDSEESSNDSLPDPGLDVKNSSTAGGQYSHSSSSQTQKTPSLPSPLKLYKRKFTRSPGLVNKPYSHSAERLKSGVESQRTRFNSEPSQPVFSLNKIVSTAGTLIKPATFSPTKSTDGSVASGLKKGTVIKPAVFSPNKASTFSSFDIKKANIIKPATFSPSKSILLGSDDGMGSKVATNNKITVSINSNILKPAHFSPKNALNLSSNNPKSAKDKVSENSRSELATNALKILSPVGGVAIANYKVSSVAPTKIIISKEDVQKSPATSLTKPHPPAGLDNWKYVDVQTDAGSLEDEQTYRREILIKSGEVMGKIENERRKSLGGIHTQNTVPGELKNKRRSAVKETKLSTEGTSSKTPKQNSRLTSCTADKKDDEDLPRMNFLVTYRRLKDDKETQNGTAVTDSRAGLPGDKSKVKSVERSEGKSKIADRSKKKSREGSEGNDIIIMGAQSGRATEVDVVDITNSSQSSEGSQTGVPVINVETYAEVVDITTEQSTPEVFEVKINKNKPIFVPDSPPGLVAPAKAVTQDRINTHPMPKNQQQVTVRTPTHMEARRHLPATVLKTRLPTVSMVTRPTPIPLVTRQPSVPVATQRTPVPVVTGQQPATVVTLPAPVPVVTGEKPVPVATLPTPVPVVTERPTVPKVTIQAPVPVITRPPQPNNLPSLPTMDITPEEKLNDKVNEVLLMFPDVDPQYVKNLLLVHIGPEALNNVCNLLLENSNYPRVQKPPSSTVSTDLSPPKRGSKNFYEEFSEVVKSFEYKINCELLLQSEFKMISVRDIRILASHYNWHYAPMHKALSLIVKKGFEEMQSEGKKSLSQAVIVGNIPVGSEERTVKVTCLKCPRALKCSLSSLPPELTEEYEFVKDRLREEAKDEDLKVAQQMNEFEYAETGQLIECGCCYMEVAFDNMVQCYEGHLFCEDCLKNYANESVFGHGKTSLLCMSDGCEASFPKSQLDKALPANILDKYNDRVQEESINLAALDDLVRCPHCDFAALLDPGDKVFSCQNTSCMKETCRYCKEDWKEHFGKRCEEIEKKDEVSLRIKFEEKMAMAKIRTCHRCKAKFMKEEGCNKMTCKCGASMCYVCRKPNISYKHFCQHLREPKKPCDKCNDCFLWSKAEEDDERAIAEIRKECEVLRMEKGFSMDKVIGAPDEPPAKKMKVK